MKPLSTILTIALAFVGLRNGFSQSFVNLDFESAQIIPLTQGAFIPGYSIATTNAVPGWSVYYGSSQQSQITFNAPAVGSTWVNLWATNGAQISGNYSVLLQGGLAAYAPATIYQTGLVPVSAVSLLFQAQPTSGAATDSLVVSLGGQSLNYFAISTGANYTLYGVDISAYAGQTEQLMFAALHGNNNNWNIDNIQFSPLAVPEPGGLALAALGGLLLGCRRWRKSSK